MIKTATPTTRSVVYVCLAAVASIFTPATATAQETAGSTESAADVLERTLADEGADAARARYRSLKAAGGQYTFDASEFIDLGHRLLQEDKVPEALAILEMTVDSFPEARWGHFLLANAYWRAGRTESAMESRFEMQRMEEKTSLEEFLAANGDSLATTAEEVIAKHLEAIGGRESVESIRTMVVKIGVNSTDGNSRKLVRYYKRPAYYRQGMENSGGFTATEGETVWTFRGGQWTVSEDQAYRRMGSIDGNFTDYADRGITYDFVGVEILNHTPVYRLKRTFQDGFEQDLFFSIESGYLTELESDYPQSYPFMKSIMSFWDYRDVGGIKIPHVFIRNMNSLGPPHGGVVEEVQVNVPLDDSLFVPPQ